MPNEEVDARARTQGHGGVRVLLSVPPEADDMFSPDVRRALGETADSVIEVRPADLADFEAFQAVAHDVDVAVVAWGFPAFDPEHLAAMPRLRLVLNAASSVRHLVNDDFWATGLPIAQAGAAMAPAVAELALTFSLALLRRLPRMDHALHDGLGWDESKPVTRAREISASTIGVVGASRTGRSYIDMCTALGADIRVYDPYLAADDPLRGRAVGLDELMAVSDIVSVHAPSTAETAGLIGASQLALLRDGVGFVNTARPQVVDMDALYEHVASGRLDAALDVYDEEPLPLGDRWRALPNVLLTPHIAGATLECRRRAGRIVVDELRRFLAGEPLQHRVTRAALERMG